MKEFSFILLLFLVIVSLGFNVSLRTEETQIHDIVGVYLNNPENFTILIKTDEINIEQKRIDNTQIALCNQCSPFVVTKTTFGTNIYGYEKIEYVSHTLYVPSVDYIDGGEAKVGKNRYNKIQRLY